MEVYLTGALSTFRVGHLTEGVMAYSMRVY